MERDLSAQLDRVVRRLWSTLAIVADDDGLETDFTPANLPRPYPAATRTSVPVLARHDA